MRQLFFIFTLLLAFVFTFVALHSQVYAGDKAVTLGVRSYYNILDEDSMGSDSDTALPTQQSVKAYSESYSKSNSYTLDLTVGAEGNGAANSDTSGNTITVTGQVVDLDGVSSESNHYVTVWLSEDNSTGAVTSNVPDGGGSAEDGVVVGDGTQLSEALSDEAMLNIYTNSTGSFTVEIYDDDAANDWYLFGTIGGRVVFSDVIDHAS